MPVIVAVQPIDVDTAALTTATAPGVVQQDGGHLLVDPGPAPVPDRPHLIGRTRTRCAELHGVHAEVERGPAAERGVEEAVGRIERCGEPEVGLDEADLADAPPGGEHPIELEVCGQELVQSASMRKRLLARAVATIRAVCR